MSFLVAFTMAMPVLACCCVPEMSQQSHVDDERHHQVSHTANQAPKDCSSAEHQTEKLVSSVPTFELKSPSFQLDAIISFAIADWLLSGTQHNRQTDFLAMEPSLNTILPVFLATQRLRI